MANETEQLTKALEETSPASSERAEEQGDVSAPAVQTSEEAQKQQEAKTYQKIQGRFDALQTRLDKAEALLKQRTQAELKAEADKRVEAQVAKFLEDGEDEQKVEGYKQAKLKYNEEAAKLNDRSAALHESKEAHDAEVVEARAIKVLHAWQSAHRDKPLDFETAITYLVTKSKGDRDVMAELVETAAIKFPFKPTDTDESTVTERQSLRPDGAYHSAPGGTDLDSMSPQEKIVIGLERASKKRR